METPYGHDASPIWERPEPRPRAAPVPLSRSAIADAAVRLADDHGLDGVSLRKLAKELGVGPMRLYDYVADKSELLDLMVDVVHGDIADATGDTAGHTDRRSDWRAAALAVARATRAAALDHEWFADLLGGRPHLGPNALAVGEATAAALERAPGVRDVDDLQRAVGAFNAVVVGLVRREVTERRTTRSTGTDESAFQVALGPYLGRMLATGRYPTVARLVVDGAHLDPGETFDHAVTTVLDGVARRPDPSSSRS